MKPITPDEVKEHRVKSIPAFVIEATNNLISKKWNGSYASFKLKELEAESLRVAEEQAIETTARKLYDDHSFDIEPVFKRSGWDVKYDQPGYNESYDSYYEFTPKKINDENSCLYG